MASKIQSFPKYPDRLVVGRILGPWGLKGHVKVENLSDTPGRFQTGSSFFIQHSEYRCDEVAFRPRWLAVKFYGVDNRNAASKLSGALLEIPRSQAPPLSDDQFYYHEIIGLEVFTTDGESVGQVVEIFPTGSNDVYVVRASGKEVLIPAIADVVESVNLVTGQIKIRPLQGLL